MTYAPFWLWMPLAGFAPWMVLLAQAWSLIYQFGIHTERIGRLARPVEAVLNTPSHHRVHHGSNEQYLDKNYGGILVIWDRLFGTFAPERERVRYGLTTDIETYNPVRVAFHEYVALWHDVRRARSWRVRAALAYHGPGWAPAAEPGGEPAPVPASTARG
jgi:sterol desaturase/sphingolipid hydroxylase (fatty acid hydroxylase superfamily)